MKKYLPTNLISIANRTGRWWLKEIKHQQTLYTTNLGSYLRLLVTNARQLKLHVLPNQNPLSPSQVYAIRIDHQKWYRYPASTQPIEVALQNNTHEIEIMTAGNTDADLVWCGNEGFAITAIELDNGTISAPASRPLINFIGDSITAGCWVNGNHASLDYRPETNYAAICTDKLNADSVRIAYSAGGVLRPATGGVPTADVFLAKTDADTLWKANKPDLVIINLGVNDRRFAEDQFNLAYASFIQQVIAMFPAAKIMVMIPFSQTYATNIRKIAATHQSPVIETAGWCNSFTDGLHPDQTGANSAGQYLAKFLSSAFK